MNRVQVLRRYLATASLLAFAVYEVGGLAAASQARDVAVFGFFAVALVVAAAGVAKRQFWARLLGLGGGIGGLSLFMALTLTGNASANITLFGALSLLVAASLFGRGMADHMTGGTYEGDVWRDRGRHGHALSAGVVTSVAVIPVLMVMTRSAIAFETGLSLSGAFALAAFLLASRKTAGLLVLFPSSAMVAALAGDLMLRLDWQDFLKDLLLRWLEGKLIYVFLAILAVVAVVTLIVSLVFAIPVSRYLARKKRKEDDRAESD